MRPLFGRLATIVLLLAAPVPAWSQDLWGTALVPGGVAAARTVLGLESEVGRVDEFLLVDLAQRFHGGHGDSHGVETFVRYVALLEQVTAEMAKRPRGFGLPAATAPQNERDSARRFLDLLGLSLVDKGRQVAKGTSREALERQSWLAAAGVNTSSLLEPLNAGSPVVVTIPTGELPLPLPKYWSTLDATQSPLLSIARSRESARLYAGLLSLDDPTLQYLTSTTGLLSQLRSTHAAPFAAFARSFHIQNGAVRSPGGDQAARLWERLAGARLTAPAAFLSALLTKDNGRLAYFFDTVAHLGAERQAWLLGPNADEVYDVFRRLDSDWDITETPFVRPQPDALAVLKQVTVERGAIAAAPWWPSMFESDSSSVDARWLLNWIFAGDVEEAIARFQMFRLAQRTARDVPQSSALQLAIVLGSVRDMPVLAAAVERMGITDLDVAARLVETARSFDADADGEKLARLGRWQLMFALIEQTALRQRLLPAKTTPLLKSLADWVPGNDEEGNAAAWLVTTLLPAIVPDVKIDDLENYERDVAVAIVARPPSEQGADAVKVFWEGIEYVLDDTFATTRDVLTIRRSQSSPTLGDIVRAHRLRLQLEAGLADLGQVATVSAEFTRILAALTKLQLRDGRERKAVVDFRRAARVVSEIKDAADIGRAAEQLPKLRTALDALVDGAMMPLVYALAVSPAGAAPASLIELPYQHSWEGVAWRAAHRDSGRAMELLVRGSVIGLDVAMAHSRLRATGRRPPRESTKPSTRTEVRQDVLFRFLRTQSESPFWGRDAARVLKAIDAGDAILGTALKAAPDWDTRLRDAGVDPAIVSIVRWQVMRGLPVNDLALSRLDAYRLGTGDPLPAGWEEGAGEGAVATDVLLRLLTASRALRVPAGMVPALLPLAFHDLVEQTPGFPRTVTRDRVEAYMLALVSGRVLARPQKKER